MDIEKKLKKLFDFQKFENNKKLEKLINETESSGTLLSDDDLFFVSAAGDPNKNDHANGGSAYIQDGQFPPPN